jgi:RNA polymerase sigma-70 factor (ECF subfamily)
MDIEKLYQEYFSIVYKYILSISKDSYLAEEVTQETFFKALKKIDDFRGESSIKVWLCQIAKNTYYDWVKKMTRLKELPDEYGQIGTSVEEECVLAADSREAHRILHDLKEPYKEVFSLRTFGELPFSDIGELFGKTDSWARVTFHRARLMIKEGLENGTKNNM